MRVAEPPAIITVAEAAALIGRTRREVYSWVARRAIPEDCYFRSGRALWFIRLRLVHWAGLPRNGREHPEGQADDDGG